MSEKNVGIPPNAAELWLKIARQMAAALASNPTIMDERLILARAQYLADHLLRGYIERRKGTL